jgi:hypothetical protein
VSDKASSFASQKSFNALQRQNRKLEKKANKLQAELLLKNKSQLQNEYEEEVKRLDGIR